jgi:hypothetical protein
MVATYEDEEVNRLLHGAKHVEMDPVASEKQNAESSETCEAEGHISECLQTHERQSQDDKSQQYCFSGQNDADQTSVCFPKQVDPPMGESVPRRCTNPERNSIVLSTVFSRTENEALMQIVESRDSLRSPNALEARLDGVKTPEHDSEEQKLSRRICFRNPFPIVKPPASCRDPDIVMNDHRVGVPDLPTRWLKPKKELKQLIVAAMGTSLARRSNACGALKILSRHKKNQLTLARTDGFLTAVTFAATQAIPSDDQALAMDARTRAVASLRNVCLAKDNRLLILKHPGVLESLAYVVQADQSEGRVLATSSLALLAKTPCCREGLIQVEGLVDVLSGVMRGCAVQPVVLFSARDDGVLFNVNPDGLERSPTVADEESASYNSDTSLDSCDSIAGKQLDSEIEPVDSIRHQAEEKNASFAAEARTNACATLLHLSKQCFISVGSAPYHAADFLLI